MHSDISNVPLLETYEEQYKYLLVHLGKHNHNSQKGAEEVEFEALCALS